MVALGSSPLNLGDFFTDVNVKLSSRRKNVDFTGSVGNSTNTWLHRGKWGWRFCCSYLFAQLGRSRSRGAGWHRAVSIPHWWHRQVPAGTCLCFQGLAALGDSANPHSKIIEAAKNALFCSGLWEPHLIILARCHLHLVLLFWPLLWSAVSLHLGCSASREGIVWAEFGLCSLSQVGAEWFYRQHQHPAALLVLHPQNTFHAYCPFSSGLEPMVLFHPWGSRAISNLKTEDTVGITQV